MPIYQSMQRVRFSSPDGYEKFKTVFADTCARCHSSKLPAPAAGLDPDGCAGPGYLDCWKKYWAWTQTDGFKVAMRKIAAANDFGDDNYMSSDAWVPVNSSYSTIPKE